MKNREKLLHTNIYDLLCQMQENIESYFVSSDDNGENICIMEILGAYRIGVRHRVADGDCKKCIAAWLNEEAT